MAGRPDDPVPELADPLALGQAAASQLGGEWQLDTFDESGDRNQESGVSEPPDNSNSSLTPDSCPLTPDRSDAPGSALRVPHFSDVPPSPEQLIEAMLFVGGHPLPAVVACTAVRGLTPDRFQVAIDSLNRRYRKQRRPYAIEPRDEGFVLSVRTGYRNLREKLFAGPREARLSQPALDVLSVVAYRQPVGKAEVDAIRGTESGATLRQLVRLGLVAVQHRADAAGREVRYGTTSRFLQVFGLSSLDELPRLGDTGQV
jgi:segregation and condensation protein B